MSKQNLYGIFHFFSFLFTAKKGADEEQRLSQLKLALTWDRVDIAQEEIFREDVLWSTGKCYMLESRKFCQGGSISDNIFFS